MQIIRSAANSLSAYSRGGRDPPPLPLPSIDRSRYLFAVRITVPPLSLIAFAVSRLHREPFGRLQNCRRSSPILPGGFERHVILCVHGRACGTRHVLVRRRFVLSSTTKLKIGTRAFSTRARPPLISEQRLSRLSLGRCLAITSSGAVEFQVFMFGDDRARGANGIAECVRSQTTTRQMPKNVIN